MHVFTYAPGHQGATLTQHTARGTRRTSCITLAAKADNFRTAGPDRPACVISTGPWMVLDDGPVYTSALIRAEFATTPASPWCQWDAVPHNAVIDGWGWGRCQRNAQGTGAGRQKERRRVGGQESKRQRARARARASFIYCTIAALYGPLHGVRVYAYSRTAL